MYITTAPMSGAGPMRSSIVGVADQCYAQSTCLETTALIVQKFARRKNLQRKIIGDYNAHKKLDAGESEADRREAIASWIKNNKKQFEDNKAKAKVVAIVGSKLDWSPYMHGVASTSVR